MKNKKRSRRDESSSSSSSSRSARSKSSDRPARKSSSTSKWQSPERSRERDRQQHHHHHQAPQQRQEARADGKHDDEHSRDRNTRSRQREYHNRHNRDYHSNSNRRNNDRHYNSRRDFDNRRDNRRRRSRSRSSSFDHSKAVWGKGDQQHGSGDKKPQASGGAANKEKEKPNFGLSGKLTEETNTYRGVVIKYSEPPEARKPKRRWRLYPFKGEKALQTLYIHRESAYLIGRDRKVVDLPVDHPSCSKQHAALQYRLVPFLRDDGTQGKRVRPYLIDLDSANGTFINNKRIEPKKYVELLERDVIKFGFSSREYVLLHENSKDEGMDDDVKQEQEEAVDVKEEAD